MTEESEIIISLIIFENLNAQHHLVEVNKKTAISHSENSIITKIKLNIAHFKYDRKSCLAPSLYYHNLFLIFLIHRIFEPS